MSDQKLLIHHKEHRRIKREVLIALSSQNYTLDRSKGAIKIKVPKKRGAPYGNKNAIGNKGNKHASPPLGNINAQKHGLYANMLYRLQMVKIEEHLIEQNQWSYEAVLYYREKVLNGEIYINPFKR